MKSARPLNLKHLRYFSEVASRGSISAAARAMFLTPQTISGQIQELEAAIGQPLFDRVGKRMVLTHAGQTALDYAKAIFAMGEELKTVLQGQARARSIVLRVGIADSVAKLQTIATLQPVIERHRKELELVCQEGSYPDLLGRVGAGELDMVLADNPVPPSLAKSLHTTVIAQSGVSFMATADISTRVRGEFPASLDEAPLLSDFQAHSALAQSLEIWFTRQGIRPRIVGRIDDSALLKGLAQAGLGIAVVPSPIEGEVAKQYRLKVLGRTADVKVSLLLVRARVRRLHPLVAELEHAHDMR